MSNVQGRDALQNAQEFLADFVPERSGRERRKLTRPNFYKGYTNCVHDRNGLLMETGKDQCDCLTFECAGCFYPCAKCSSTKCGLECRRNRKWTPAEIEIEGSGIKLSANKLKSLSNRSTAVTTD